MFVSFIQRILLRLLPGAHLANIVMVRQAKLETTSLLGLESIMHAFLLELIVPRGQVDVYCVVHWPMVIDQALHFVAEAGNDQPVVQLLLDVVGVRNDMHASVAAAKEHLLIEHFLAFEQLLEYGLTADFSRGLVEALLVQTLVVVPPRPAVHLIQVQRNLLDSVVVFAANLHRFAQLAALLRP